MASFAASDIWMSGDYISTGHGSPTRALLLHWNGTAWTQVPSPNPSPGENFLGGLAVTSPTNVWAGGSYFLGRQDQTEQALVFHCC